jgi:peptide deformylase
MGCRKYTKLTGTFMKNKVINCFTKKNPVLYKVCKKVTVEEGMKIATELFGILNECKDGIGLAANQVGIDAQVAVVNVREPLILINPEVIEKFDEIDYYEGCLSFPKKGVHTQRYKNIVIHTEQEESNWYFSGVPTDSGRGTWEEGESKKDDSDLRLLEAIAVQHEVDHLNGIVCMDRQHKLEPFKIEESFGRNEKVRITNGSVDVVMKYKKARPLILSGIWKIAISGSAG